MLKGAAVVDLKRRDSKVQLSDKDLHYLTDEMSWELLAMKKCNHYAGLCQDASVQSLINQIGQMHQRHYEMLLSQIQSSTGAASTSQPNAANQQMN
ncbi:hypothetical protein I8U17_12050 [Thermoactinomyces sp. CICC 10521]|jgi:hypothetical protein|uniref:Spore coat protein n=1 Tax=Thermoactinomyces daqus TaxID=1329516 RepID=A0A7W2AHF3_9BACL|nr:hypothetical protein [Thermoactinomyces daqus]MBH8608340.1 hypothetical protein [Thermoactinomyces sp. CICC 10521]